MKRRIEVPVEPLSESRWAHVEREVFDALDDEQAARDLGAIAPGPAPRPRRWIVWGVAAAAAIAALAAVAIVFPLRPPPGPTPIARQAPPSRVETTTAPSRVSLPGVEIDVAPSSALAVNDEASVSLERGRVECEVQARGARPPFVVTARDVTVRVIGTHFSVTVDGDDVTVTVAHGVVEVTGSGRTARVAAGESWSTPRVVASAPTATAPPASVATAARPAPSASPAERFEAASRLERTDPDRAAAQYAELARGTGPWAENALFAQGRLEADRGHKAEARRLLEAYVAKHPNGPNATDARVLLRGLE